jgi:hypothetical protein
MNEIAVIVLGVGFFLTLVMAPMWLPLLLDYMQTRRREKQAHELEMKRIQLRMLEGPPAED